jgi:hypothetical protein
VQDAENILFLDVVDTAHTSIEVIELYETEANSVTLITPFALKADWHIQIREWFNEYPLFSLSVRDAETRSTLLI